MDSEKDARRKYAQHKKNAKERGIPFDLTYEEWREIWGDRLHLRGRRANELHMCRTLDQGGYTKGNVRIDTAAANHDERFLARMHRVPQWRARGNEPFEIDEWHTYAKSPEEILLEREKSLDGGV